MVTPIPPKGETTDHDEVEVQKYHPVTPAHSPGGFRSIIRRRLRGAGISMAEIVIAIGFISVITTSLLAVAGKGLQLSLREVDVAGAYQHCEALMEEMSFQAGRAESWDALASISTPQYPNAADGTDAASQDREFAYTVSVVEVGSELKRVQVRVYIAKSNSEVAAADTRLPKGGEIVRMTNFYPRP